mmetsp:Transcript_31801/g.68845  ORF Transcript_31801/g.68845 Transcript_31801/m.68845 type:complete len:2148 (-) Transcript_31801:1362-7805(-)
MLSVGNLDRAEKWPATTAAAGTAAASVTTMTTVPAEADDSSMGSGRPSLTGSILSGGASAAAAATTTSAGSVFDWSAIGGPLSSLGAVTPATGSAGGGADAGAGAAGGGGGDSRVDGAATAQHLGSPRNLHRQDEEYRQGTRQDQQNQSNRPDCPWNDDDDMDLWRRHNETTTGSTTVVGISKSSANTSKLLVNGRSPSRQPGEDEEEDENEDEYPYYYGYDYRPTIRDWSAAASAAAAAAAAASASSSVTPNATSPPRSSPHPEPDAAAAARLPRQYHVDTTVAERQQPPPLSSSPSPPSKSEEHRGGDIRHHYHQQRPQDDNDEEDDEIEDDPLSTRRHWMPDRLCRHCYACEAPFTVFRRRHHCRLCGQVFCSACSAYFVDVCDPASSLLPPDAPVSAAAAAASDGAVSAAAGSTVGVTVSGSMGADECVVGERGKRMNAASTDESSPHQGIIKTEGKGSGSSHPSSPPAAMSSTEAGVPVGGEKEPPSSAAMDYRTIRTCKTCFYHLTEQREGSAEAGFSSVGEAEVGGSGLLFGPRRGRATLHANNAVFGTERQQGQGEREDLSGTLLSHLRPDDDSGLAPKEQRFSPTQAGDDKEDGEMSEITRSESNAELDYQHPPSKKHSSAEKERRSQSEGKEAEEDQYQNVGEAYMQQTSSFPLAGTDGFAPAERKVDISPKTKIADANRRLGLTAAKHLEKMGRELLLSDAPLLLKEIGYASSVDDKGLENTPASMRAEKALSSWIDTLMLHASRCCATVEPNVKKGDLLDIRPYCKVKVISGGFVSDCSYMSGVIFRKNVTHKSMAKGIASPTIMLLSGGLDYTQRIASLDTLREQEDTYMEILVNKIIKLKPDLLIVGRSVSRRAQELLLKANVALIQHVKASLMSRIARQTGATVISSTDHAMNQFGRGVLGSCKRFRLVTFRDNESWSEKSRRADPGSHSMPSYISDLLASRELPNHHRQAVLAASVLGENVIDGSDAVKQGLAKRGVAFTYAMIEGCPKQLGCTVVLRGASRGALKQVKRVFRFLVNIAYNLRLEMSYLRDRGAMLPADYAIPTTQTCSSSLCVEYGDPPQGRKVRPWNGGKNDISQRSLSNRITAFDHQSILITSVWMLRKTQNQNSHQCCPAEVKGICYYSAQDVSLGQFLRDSCFNLGLKCQNPSCKKSVLDHTLSFIHNDSLINITVEHMDKPLPPGPDGDGDKKPSSEDETHQKKPVDRPIATWTYCNSSTCSKVTTPLVFLGEDTWKYSFGKFLETFFYNRSALLNSPEHGCFCQMQSSSTLYFGCGNLAARFTYEKINPFGVFVRKTLPFEPEFHQNDSLRQLEVISTTSSDLFVAFDKNIERILRDVRLLFGSANRPEHLQILVSELNGLASEVDAAAKTLQENVALITSRFYETEKEIDGGIPAESLSIEKTPDSVANESLFRFPWQSRRYLFMLTTAWNERLSAVGRSLTAMQKLSKKLEGSHNSRDVSAPQTGGDAYDDINTTIKRIQQLQTMYSHYNVYDINNSMQVPLGTDANPLRRGSGHDQRINNFEYQDDETDDIALDYDDDFNEDYGGGTGNDYAEVMENVDADVVESRRRMQSWQDPSQRPRKGYSKQAPATTVHLDNSDPTDSPSKTGPASAGGAVKSALTRLFNRGAKDLDPCKINLGILSGGRPRLEPGVTGLVVPVFDDQPSTIIAYSLSSVDYDNQFKFFTKSSASADGASSTVDGNERAIEGMFTGGMDAGAGSAARTGKPPLRRDASGSSKSTYGKAGGTPTTLGGGTNGRKSIEAQMLVRAKSHIKHTFRDFDHKGQPICKFVCTSYWATQFHAVRQAFLAAVPQNQQHASKDQGTSSAAADVENSYIRSLSAAYSWAVSGGKSGASFSRTDDGRFIVKCISRTELQMFLDCAPAYFEYLSKAFFHGLPTVLCKIVGVYQIGYHNRLTGKRTMEQVAVMQNIFHGRKISKVFDLKGSLRGRFTQQLAEKGRNAKRHGSSNDLADLDSPVDGDPIGSSRHSDGNESGFSPGEDAEEADLLGPSVPTLLDGDFLEFTSGRPLPLNDRSKAVFHMSILNDTLFLSIINVLDYSILVGIDEEKWELVVGIIDYMRQYDILKQMERVGKSIPMVVGSEAPTIIQPPLYKSRFTNAMERYFMTVPSKWTNI